MKRTNKGRYEDRHLIGIDAYYVDANVTVLILIRTLYIRWKEVSTKNIIIGIDAYYVDATIEVLILIRTLYTQDDTRDE